MEDDTICNTIIEGCLPNTPSRIQCEPIELDIPTNVQVLFESDTYHPHKYPLYATTSDFSTYDVVHNPFFEKGSISTPHTSFSGGWPVKEHYKNFNWIFDAQRSVITRDGRLYISATYFQEPWRWYLERVPIILKQCSDIFFEGKEHFADV